MPFFLKQARKMRFASLALSKDFVASNVTIMYGFPLTLVIIAKHFPDGLINPSLTLRYPNSHS